jgi:hypothetical protein
VHEVAHKWPVSAIDEAIANIDHQIVIGVQRRAGRRLGECLACEQLPDHAPHIGFNGTKQHPTCLGTGAKQVVWRSPGGTVAAWNPTPPSISIQALQAVSTC